MRLNPNKINKLFTVNDPLLEYDFYVYVYDDYQQAMEKLNKRFKNKTSSLCLGDNWAGAVHSDFPRKGHSFVTFNTKHLNLSAIVHESVHMSLRMLQLSGIRINSHTEEIHCRHVEFILEAILKKLINTRISKV